MAFHTGDIDVGWLKLGLTLRRGKRHVQPLLFVNGKLILRTYRSRGSGEVSESNLIRQQMRLNDDRFGDVVKCLLRGRAYLEILLASFSSKSTTSPAIRGERTVTA